MTKKTAFQLALESGSATILRGDKIIRLYKDGTFDVIKENMPPKVKVPKGLVLHRKESK